MTAMLTIGKLAALARTSVDTIRYYERLRLVPQPPRTASGYRQYPPQTVRRLLLVRSAQRFGFSLKEIASFLAVRDAGGKPCHEVRASAERILGAMDAQIRELAVARRRLRRVLQEWDDVLARTPANERAHLLERLAVGIVGRARQRHNALANRGRPQACSRSR